MPHLTVPEDAILPPRRTDVPVGNALSNHGEACFACGQESGLKMTIEFSSEYQVKGKFFVRETFQGGPGVMHGGLLSLALDEVLGDVTRTVAPHAVTGTLEVTYLHPVLIKQEITLRARVLGVLRRKIYVSGEAFSAKHSTPVATARAVFISINANKHYMEALSALNVHQA